MTEPRPSLKWAVHYNWMKRNCLLLQLLFLDLESLNSAPCNKFLCEVPSASWESQVHPNTLALSRGVESTAFGKVLLFSQRELHFDCDSALMLPFCEGRPSEFLRGEAYLELAPINQSISFLMMCSRLERGVCFPEHLFNFPEYRVPPPNN